MAEYMYACLLGGVRNTCHRLDMLLKSVCFWSKSVAFGPSQVGSHL